MNMESEKTYVIAKNWFEARAYINGLPPEKAERCTYVRDAEDLRDVWLKAEQVIYVGNYSDRSDWSSLYDILNAVIL